jgi:carotenoid cleavage dioxygenase-like enzyme
MADGFDDWAKKWNSPTVKYPPLKTPPGAFGSGCWGIEEDLRDLPVTGDLPKDLDGAFYRVGPDPQFPKAPEYANVPFDGEGHASMFRIKNGRVDFRSRYVRNERWKAQAAAGRALFGMYRNPGTNDPAFRQANGTTSNTQMWFHHGKLLAMKEDGPPTVLDPETLEVTQDAYDFGGAMKGKTFTAHPKIDSLTGELIGFGYEAAGLGSSDVEVFTVDKAGKLTWSAWIKVPYASMIHDFAVTDRHIAFLVFPLAVQMDEIAAGRLHFAWDSSLKTYLGVMARGGDGADIRWFEGPQIMATHTMGCWSQGDRLFVDCDGGEGNQFPFFPNKNEPWDEAKSLGRLRRLSVDLGDPDAKTFQMEVLHPQIMGALARQDDRYHTLPYRYGFMMTFGPQGMGWTMFDHKENAARTWQAGPGNLVSEMCFVPRTPDAPEGDGYLIGVVTRMAEGGRSDLVFVDTRNIEAGPVAVASAPRQICGQVHGFWVDGSNL